VFLDAGSLDAGFLDSGRVRRGGRETLEKHMESPGCDYEDEDENEDDFHGSSMGIA
jgi:hypothetical protein